MFRALVYLILFSLAVSVLRSVLAIIGKAVSGQKDTSTRAGGNSRPSSSQAAGELKKDPVCGTFISTETAFQKATGGKTYYFCSTECRDKFQAA